MKIYVSKGNSPKEKINSLIEKLINSGHNLTEEIEKSEVVILMDDWDESENTKEEIKIALKNGKTIFGEQFFVKVNCF